MDIKKGERRKEVKKFLSVSVLVLCFIVFAPVVEAQNYDGWVSKQITSAVHSESRGIDVDRRFVKWGGKKLSWVFWGKISYHGSVHENNSIVMSPKTTRLIGNNKVVKGR